MTTMSTDQTGEGVAARLRRRLAAAASGLATWWAVARRYRAAAAAYEDLARLSDAELARRGLNRATLAWDLCEDQNRDGTG